MKIVSIKGDAKIRCLCSVKKRIWPARRAVEINFVLYILVFFVMCVLGICIVLLGVLFTSVWQVFEVEETDLQPQIVEGRVSVPLNVTLESSLAEEATEEPVNAVQSELSKLLADQEQLLKQEFALTQNSNTATKNNDIVTTALPLSVSALKSSDDNKAIQEAKNSDVLLDEPPVVVKPVIVAAVKEVIPKPKPKEAAPAAPKVVAKVDPESRSKVAPPSLSVAQQWLKEEQLLSWPSGGYTLQVLGARSEGSIVQFMQSLDSQNRLYYFTTVYKNAPWHVVVYGQYANRTAALCV